MFYKCRSAFPFFHTSGDAFLWVWAAIRRQRAGCKAPCEGDVGCPEPPMRRDDTGIETETRRRLAGPRPDDTRKIAPLAASRAPTLADRFADKGNTIACLRNGAVLRGS